MGRLPYYAVGEGPPLAVLGGLSPETGVESDGAVRFQSTFTTPFASVRRVHFFNRRAHLPRGMTMADIAAEHADALRAGLAGEAVDVLGVSTGGSIAQQLAADHPDVVRRLVLVSTACRLGPNGRDLQRRVAARIRRGANSQAIAVMAAGTVPALVRLPVAVFARFSSDRIAHDPKGLYDMATTIEAEDEFDLAGCPTIAAPTLIVAGGKDRFYSSELFRETERLIPNARLCLFERRGHVTVAMGSRFGRLIREFLAAP
jgi:pimeloyl-ACP methyl ester carboxylesterase